MQLIGPIGVAGYCTAALVVGIRLSLLARRTHQLPERLIGIAFICGGSLGYTSLVAAGIVKSSAPLLASALFYAGWSGLAAASACLVLFWQSVYHADHPAARRVVAPGMIVLVGTTLGIFHAFSQGVSIETNPWYLVGLCMQGGAYGLNAWSSTRYYLLLRRRLVLGLADPVVANRILLWGIASWAITLQYTYSIGSLVISGQSLTRGPGVAVISALGLVAAANILLAFFPPRVYLEHVQRSVSARG